MKRSPLIFVALTPFVAAAGGGDKAAKMVNHDELRDDWRVSEVIGSEVESNDGQQYGEVQDIVLSADGRIESVLISADDLGTERDQATIMEDDAGFDRTGAATTADRDAGTIGATGETVDADETGMAGAQTGTVSTETGIAGTESTADTGAGTAGTETAGEPSVTGPDRTTGTAQVGGDEGGLFGMGDDENLVAVDWSSPDFNADENVIRLDVDPTQVHGTAQVSADTGMQEGDATLTAGAETATAGTQEFRASDLLEMDVKLSDDEDFGSVEDILVNAEGEASAVVVSAGNFLDRQQYALPVDLNSVNAEEQVISYDLSAQELEEQGEFDLDEQREGA